MNFPFSIRRKRMVLLLWIKGQDFPKKKYWVALAFNVAAQFFAPDEEKNEVLSNGIVHFFIFL